MRIRVRWPVAAGLLAGLAVFAEGGAVLSDPTAEQVMDTAVEAIGGKEAWEKVRTIVIRSRSEILGMKVMTEEIRQAPDRMYTCSEVAGTKTEIGFDGTRAWMRHPMLGLRDIDAKGLEAQPFSIGSARDWRACFTGCELKGKEKVGDREAYKLVLTSRGGTSVTRWYDAATGLLLQQTAASPESPNLEVTATFDDYREVEGIKLPFKTVARTPMGNAVSVVESIQLNGDVDDEKFRKPAKQASGNENRKAGEAPVREESR